MSGSKSAMMMSLLAFKIVVILGVVTSQKHDVNSQTSYSGMTRRRSVEGTTAFPPDPTVNDEGMRFLLTRLETLCVEKLEYLITDTNRRFQSLENQLIQSSSCPASPVVQNIENMEVKMGNLEVKMENLEIKMENLGKQFNTETQKTIEKIEELMNATRNVPSDVETIKQNVSSIINVTRSLVDFSSNSELKQFFNEGLNKLKDLQTATPSSPHNLTVMNKQYPKNCREVRESEKMASGNFMIQPQNALKPFEVVCDLETRGGGWTVIQNRFDGSQDFFLDWQNYKNGFGNLGGEFWLGLENIYLLTGVEVNELLIELGDFELQNKSALYSDFSVGSEVEGYSLKVLGTYSGDAGDSLTYHSGMKFSTKDNDQDESNSEDCAKKYTGAWWYYTCYSSNLNGKYSSVPKESTQSVTWYYLKNNYYSLKRTRMLVRPKV